MADANGERDELRELIRSYEDATPDYRGDGEGGEYYDPYTDFDELTAAVWAWVQDRYAPRNDRP